MFLCSRSKAIKPIIYLFIILITPLSASEKTQTDSQQRLDEKVARTANLFWESPVDKIQNELKKTNAILFTEQKETKDYQNIRDLYHIALEYSPSIQNNIAELNVSNARQLEAESFYYPTISANYSLTRSDNKTVAAYNQNVFSLSLLQYLYNAESIARNQQTQVQVDSSKIAIQSARQQLVIDIARRWTDALHAQDNKKLSSIEVESSKKIFEKAKQALEVGIGKRLDVAQAEAAYKLAIAQQIERQSNYKVALQNLENLTGIHITSIPQWNKHKTTPLSNLTYSKKLQKNINIQRQVKTLESAVLEIDAVRGQLYPNVSLRLAYNDTEYTATEFNSNNPLLITLQFEWELFSGFRTTANIDRSYAQLNQQKAQLKSTILEQKAQLNNIMAVLLADEKRIPAIQQQVDASRIAYDAFKQSYQVGTENLPNVLDAQKDYQQAQINLSRSTYQYWINYLNFKYITGQISYKDLP